jgi:hypothetical protein
MLGIRRGARWRFIRAQSCDGCLRFAASCRSILSISMQGSFDCVSTSLREAATPLKMTRLRGDGRPWSESVGISARLFILTSSNDSSGLECALSFRLLLSYS